MSRFAHCGQTRFVVRRLKSFDLNLLIALDALLTERSVTQAARRCGTSQPTMSVALRKLREYFSDPLLIASGRKLRLSVHARGLAAPVRETVSMLQEMLRPYSQGGWDTGITAVRNRAEDNGSAAHQPDRASPRR